MKHKSYNTIITLFIFGFLGTSFAQKYNKQFTEKFTVNKDVEVVINASNVEVNVVHWDKNEVQVDAFIEIEGLSKEEAEKYFKNWNFEALGNTSKVKISAIGNNPIGLRNDFVIHDNFTFPDIQLPDFDSIVFPDMNFDFDIDFGNIFDDIDKNMGKDGKYEFRWQDGEHNVEINSKEEWEAFKQTKEYAGLKKKMQVDKEKMKIELAKAKLEYKNTNKEEIKRGLEEAKKQLSEMKLKFNSNFDDLIIDGKKIKINKRLEIKAPKEATFDLNTRHSNVKLPETAASGNIKYGSFYANNLIGGNLNIDFSKVTIADLNACTLFLNNVTDAYIASVTNTTISNNSSDVIIEKINENVAISDRFGALTIQNIIPNYKTFKLVLDNSEAELRLSTSNDKIKLLASNVVLPSKISEDKKTLTFNGVIQAYSNDNTFKIDGKNSKLTIIKENL